MPPAPSFAKKMRSASTPFWVYPDARLVPIEAPWGRDTGAGPANPDGWTGSSTMACSKRPKPPSPRRRTAERRCHVLRADRWRNARIGLEDTIPAASTASCERYRQGPYQVPGLHRTLQELGYEPRRPEADCRRDDIEPIRRTAFVTDSGSTTRILAYPGREQVRSHARIMRRSH
jgi:hypothetical protein